MSNYAPQHSPLPSFIDPAKTTQNAQPQDDISPPDASTQGSPLQPTMTGGKMLGAVSTLLALTPRGRTDEITRLTALAHGFIGLASEEEIVTLAKAVAGRDDIGEGLIDRLARASRRAAHTLIRANSVGDETIAYLLETADHETRILIAGHHRLMPRHVMILVANGEPGVLKALLANRLTDLDAKARKAIQGDEEAAPTGLEHLENRSSMTDGSAADPKKSADDFVQLDPAARRAVMRRLAEDGPKRLSLADAAKTLDPTRNDADLTFLTVIEHRDPSKLRDAFATALDLDPVIVGKLVDEADGDAMVVLAKAAGLSSTAFARMVILSKIGLTGSPRDTFKLVDRFKAIPEATAHFIVKAMRGETPARQPAQPASPALRRLTPADVQPVVSRGGANVQGNTQRSPQSFRKAV